MNSNVNFVFGKRLEKTADSLRKNRMEAFVVQTSAEVAPLVKGLVPAGSLISVGGSATLAETGILDLLRCADYNFLDRYAPGADNGDIFRKSFSSDIYFSSANALTLNGEIYNVDGTGNRVAALAFGPKKVIYVVGINKIVDDIAAARLRVKQIAAPANNQRLGIQNPCFTTGFCSDCSGPTRICCTELVQRQQQDAGRIKVILVNENLGF